MKGSECFGRIRNIEAFEDNRTSVIAPSYVIMKNNIDLL